MDLHTDHDKEIHAKQFFFLAVWPYLGLFLLVWDWRIMQDIVEAKEFLAKKGVDVGSEWDQF